MPGPTPLTPVTPIGGYPTLPLTALSAALTFVASDNVNGNSFVLTGRELLLLWNTTGGALTVTISSSNDPQKRTGDISAYSVPANAWAMFGPLPIVGWAQSDGTLLFTTSDAGLEAAVLRLPTVQ